MLVYQRVKLWSSMSSMSSIRNHPIFGATPAADNVWSNAINSGHVQQGHPMLPLPLLTACNRTAHGNPGLAIWQPFHSRDDMETYGDVWKRKPINLYADS